MQEILDAIQSGASADDFANLAIPDSYRAVHVLKAEQDMWAGVPSKEKDPRTSLHVGEVPTPELAPDEVYLAVMASSINFNTVWSSIFEPVSTFGPMARLARDLVGAPVRLRVTNYRLELRGPTAHLDEHYVLTVAGQTLPPRIARFTLAPSAGRWRILAGLYPEVGTTSPTLEYRPRSN